MLIRYMRVSKADRSHVLGLQRNVLLAARVHPARLYKDHAAGTRDDRPGLEACMASLRCGDTLVAWKLDRLGRDLHHLVTLAHELTWRGVGLHVLAGDGATANTTAPNGRLMFGVSAALAEFERELVVGRTKARLASAHARGRHGGRASRMTPAKLRLAQPVTGRRETAVDELCADLGVTRRSLHRRVDPESVLRPDGERLLRQHQGRTGTRRAVGLQREASR